MIDLQLSRKLQRDQADARCVLSPLVRQTLRRRLLLFPQSGLADRALLFPDANINALITAIPIPDGARRERKAAFSIEE